MKCLSVLAIAVVMIAAIPLVLRGGEAPEAPSSSREPEARSAWQEAIRAVASLPAYGGLELKPQAGLVPLGADPDSGLWEFAHLGTGVASERDVTSGRLRLTEKSGLVFVLIPPGTFTMGPQEMGPPERILRYHENCYPVHEVTLGPFFLSKYEMTQAQWERVTGSNPSRRFVPGRYPDGHGLELHPVDSISWIEADDVLRKLGLILPTEAQWEYAARAGTTGPWWTGHDPVVVIEAFALAQRFWIHLPIGGRPRNPWGLADVHGNVSEWCRDRYQSYRIAARPGDGLRQGEGFSAGRRSATRLTRGGNITYCAQFVRSAWRDPRWEGFKANYLGLRPARRIAR